ncbi:hypothetical protein YC2023_065054 [Brassica napus]
MELDGVGNHSEVNLAVAETTSQKSEDEEEMVKMIRMLHQVLREVIQWQGQEEVAVRKQRQEDGKPCSKRSFIREDDNESEKDEGFNLVAFGAHKDEASTSSESDSESEEGKYDEGQDDDLKECYQQKDLQVEKEEARQARVKLDETQKGKTENVSMSAMKPVVKMYARTTSYGKTAVKTATATRTASSSATRKILEAKVSQAIEGEATY